MYLTEIAELIRELNSDVLNIQISDSVQKKKGSVLVMYKTILGDLILLAGQVSR